MNMKSILGCPKKQVEKLNFNHTPEGGQQQGGEQ